LIKSFYHRFVEDVSQENLISLSCWFTMNSTRKKYIKYPFEYFAAQVEFGVRIAQIKKISRKKAFLKYTDIYGALTNHTFADNKKNKWVKGVLADFEKLVETTRNIDSLSFKTYKLFLTTPFAKTGLDLPKSRDTLRFGCFRLNNSSYYKKRGLVRLHFSPTRQGMLSTDLQLRASDLSSVYLDSRNGEFSQMINYIYENPQKFGNVTHFMSSTWMQGLPVYQSFFPESSVLYRKPLDDVFMWLWGQFMKWDFTGNERRFQEFKKNVRAARNMSEVAGAVPFKVYEVLIPIEEMFAKYVPGYVNEKTENVGTIESVAIQQQFGTSHPLHSHTVYQSKE